MRLIPYHDLSHIYGITYSRRQLGRLEQSGQFPRRFKFGDAAQYKIAWVVKDILKWLDAA